MAAPTGPEAAAFDRRAIDERAVPEPTLMENAGRSAALLLQRLHPRGEVVALVGAGNNGGDALVLLRTLRAWGREVRAILVADRPPSGGALLHGWDIPLTSDDVLQEDPEAYDRRLAGASVLVDGILGTGIRGAPRPRQAAAIRALGRQKAPVVALDLPSGVDASTGAVAGEAVRAAVTIAFGWPKLGTLLQPGRSRTGRLLAVEIGFPPVPHRSEGEPTFAAAVTTPAWAASYRPRRDPDSHKYSVGSLLLLAGRQGMAGAAVMAAHAALRSGIGLVQIASHPENRVIVQESVPEAIFIDASDPDALREAAEDAGAVAAGPGIGTDQEAAERLRIVLEATPEDSPRPLVLDADALTLIGAGEAPSLEELGRAAAVLLTPHAGEMTRISGYSKEEIQEDRVAVARETAARTGCAVLLKGLPSIVASPSGRLLVDSMASSDLAAAGMGDVLTGVCGSFLGQGVEAPERAGALALYHAGRAARIAGRGAGLVPGDVIERLPDALAEEGEGETELDLPFLVFDLDPAR